MNPQINLLGVTYFLDFCMGLIRGGLKKSFLVVGHSPVNIALLVDYFFDATHTSSRIFF